MSHILQGESPDLMDYDDDGEIGAGRRILDLLNTLNLTNIVIFIVRYHSGRNLGVRHFKLILELVNELANLNKNQNNYKSSNIVSQHTKIKTGTRRSKIQSSCFRGGSNAVCGRLQRSSGSAILPNSASPAPNYHHPHTQLKVVDNWGDSDWKDSEWEVQNSLSENKCIEESEVIDTESEDSEVVLQLRGKLEETE